MGVFSENDLKEIFIERGKNSKEMTSFVGTRE